ncbi:multidrug efflux SMR transporter [Pasteurellaceae bacterium HPA106]|uniref:DMT family transporter n=1 Tax=Spirabiliibacterium pneumoniae TaxID=221400 RepID=UPI001AAC7EA9|nr:multidrug efflux SMR transporter [Spirabiliibacterium pneumoniae]MBE2897068.1 multidrug efflux SMR transporter [Spirabiliibacterium pneumoniae]
MAWVYLVIAILSEVLATSFLKSTHEFTRSVPTVLVLMGYGLSFYFLTLSLRSLPVGIAYAIWASLGIVLVTLFGWLFYQQKLDIPAMIGIGLIISGVLVINLLSKSAVH